jgi:hypothetical protein
MSRTNIYLTEQEREFLIKEAEENNFTLNEWINRILWKHVEEKKEEK